VVEPIDPAERDHFQIPHVAPRALAMNELSFVEPVHRLGEGVITVTDASNLWFDAGFGQTLGIANGQILPAAIRVLYQATFLNMLSVMQGLFKSIEDKVSFGRPQDPPCGSHQNCRAGQPRWRR